MFVLKKYMKQTTSKKQVARRILLGTCLAYSFTLKMEAEGPS
jgi:hypothetical protein